jgi:hypothetical protein
MSSTTARRGLPSRIKAALARRLPRQQTAGRDDAALHDALIDNAALRASVGMWAPGEHYSPIPSAADVAHAIAGAGRSSYLPGIDIDVEAMLTLGDHFEQLRRSGPARTGPARYDPDNEYFGPLDAFALEGMLLDRRPARLVEVGSGWSSAVMLDVIDQHPDLEIEFTFIDPDPARLDSLLRAGDDGVRATVLRNRVQDVDPAIFRTLQAGDVLFIDSSHVLKAGSDVKELLLDVVPALPSGVIVHVHDIEANFEYPEDWLKSGRYWNEAYLLRALLSHSPRYHVLWFSAWVRVHRAADSPIPPEGAGSIWFEVV